MATVEPAAVAQSVLAGGRVAANVVLERLSRAQRPRVPEPMVMDDPAAVAAFHVADPIAQLPIYRFNALAMSSLLPEDGAVLDLGSGSGRLLAHLADARPDIRAVGTDLSDTMLAAGSGWLRDAGLVDRVELRKADITELPPDLGVEVDLVSTVWALHHLPAAEHLRGCLPEMARIREATGCAVWVFDFARLRRDSTFEALAALSRDAPQRLREDGIASERAAWSRHEMREALDGAGLGDLRGGPDRRLGALQAYYAPRRDGRPAAHSHRWSAPPLPRVSELLFRAVCGGIPRP